MRLSVIDVQGREVARLVDEPSSAGWHRAVWRARNSAGGLAAGAYLVRLQADGKGMDAPRGVASLIGNMVVSRVTT